MTNIHGFNRQTEQQTNPRNAPLVVVPQPQRMNPRVIAIIGAAACASIALLSGAYIERYNSNDQSAAAEPTRAPDSPQKAAASTTAPAQSAPVAETTGSGGTSGSEPSSANGAPPRLNGAK